MGSHAHSLLTSNPCKQQQNGPQHAKDCFSNLIQFGYLAMFDYLYLGQLWQEAPVYGNVIKLPSGKLKVCYGK